MAVDYFLDLRASQVQGEDMMGPGEEGLIRLEAWSYGERNTGKFSHGSGGGSGRVTWDDFSLIKRVDKSSPKLMILCAKGDHLAEAKVHARKAGGKQQIFCTWTFKELLITSFNTSGGGGSDDYPTESITLNYSSAGFEYRPQLPSGDLGATMPASYDIKRMTGM